MPLSLKSAYFFSSSALDLVLNTSVLNRFKLNLNLSNKPKNILFLEILRFWEKNSASNVAPAVNRQPGYR